MGNTPNYPTKSNKTRIFSNRKSGALRGPKRGEKKIKRGHEKVKVMRWNQVIQEIALLKFLDPLRIWELHL